MAKNEKHHYVPRFYLNGWTMRDEQSQAERLTRVQWKNGKFLIERVAPRSTACVDRLYSLDNVPREAQQEIETGFLARVIDGPAGNVIHKMRTAGRGHDLDKNEREIMTRFLMLLRVRSPEIIALLNRDAPEELRRNLQEAPEEYEAIKAHEDPESLLEYFERLAPGYIEDYGKRLIPALVMDDKTFNKIVHMHWWLMNFQQVGALLLASDHPFVIMPGLDHLGCVLALRVSPELAFFACDDERIVRFILDWDRCALAEWLNGAVVRLASEQVFAMDDSQADFIMSRLRISEGSEAK